MRQKQRKKVNFLRREKNTCLKCTWWIVHFQIFYLFFFSLWILIPVCARRVTYYRFLFCSILLFFSSTLCLELNSIPFNLKFANTNNRCVASIGERWIVTVYIFLHKKGHGALSKSSHASFCIDKSTEYFGVKNNVLSIDHKTIGQKNCFF